MIQRGAAPARAIRCAAAKTFGHRDDKRLGAGDIPVEHFQNLRDIHRLMLAVPGVEIGHHRNRLVAKLRLPRERRLGHRSEEHTSELQSLMRISYAVFCLKKKKTKRYHPPVGNSKTITMKA